MSLLRGGVPLYLQLAGIIRIPIAETVHRISATTADEAMTRVLEVKKGEPLLLVYRNYYAVDTRPVELSVVYYDVKKLEYTIRLRRQVGPERG